MTDDVRNDLEWLYRLERKIARRVAKFENDSERAAFLMDMFGRDGRMLLERLMMQFPKIMRK